MIKKNIKEFLDEKVVLYNNNSFIETDPISIPHLFTKKEDIEIAGFLAATIAWGQRKTIMNNANRLMQLMDMAPYDFVVNAGVNDYRSFQKFVHRTFNGEDCVYFLKALKHIYKKHGSLEQAFLNGMQKEDKDVRNSISGFREVFFSMVHPQRTRKHVSDPSAKSSAKRLCMYLRWMVRKDKCGVDFGIWKKIKPSQLCLPLDVHTGNISRKLGLLQRTQNDWQAVEEITGVLRRFDKNDPVKYDFALFGLGAFEKF
jgi:uncharacterized protein (TIGR02757 family)